MSHSLNIAAHHYQHLMWGAMSHMGNRQCVHFSSDRDLLQAYSTAVGGSYDGDECITSKFRVALKLGCTCIESLLTTPSWPTQLMN